MFEIKVDGSIWRSISLPRLMTMSHLTTTAGAPAGSQTLSGKQIATELTNEINKAFGDDKHHPMNWFTLFLPHANILMKFDFKSYLVNSF